MVAPADKVVHEDVISSDNDVNHSWWVPQLGGKIDAIPGRTNHTWFKAPGRHLRRAVRRALRASSTRVMTAHRAASCRAAEYEQLHRASAQADAAGVALGKEEFEHVCSTATGSTTHLRRPRARQQPAPPRPQGHRDDPPQGRRARCRRSAATGRTRRSTRLIAYTKTVKRRAVATSAETSSACTAPTGGAAASRRG